MSRRLAGKSPAARATSTGLASLALLLPLCAGVGFLAADRRDLALALAALAVLAAALAVRPVLVAVAAVPAAYGFQEIGLGGGLGISDAAVLAGALLALPALVGTEELRRLGSVTRAFTVYLALILPSAIANHSPEGDREVVHRVILVVGAALVGAWIVREKADVAALRLLLAVSVGFAAACVADALRSGFEPAEPFGYNKNYIGSLLALTLLVVLCAPAHVALKAAVRLPAVVVLVAGALAAQSRGALLGAAVGGLLWLFAPRESGGVSARTRVAALLLTVSFASYTGYTVRQQLTAENAELNSTGVRFNAESATKELWEDSPALGVGVRYFTTGDFGPDAVASNNALNSEMAESGAVGTLGFVLLHDAVIVILWRRRRSQLGLAALAVFAGQLVHGQVDIYWSSGLTAFCFLLVGMAVAATPDAARATRARSVTAIH